MPKKSNDNELNSDIKCNIKSNHNGKSNNNWKCDAKCDVKCDGKSDGKGNVKSDMKKTKLKEHQQVDNKSQRRCKYCQEIYKKKQATRELRKLTSLRKKGYLKNLQEAVDSTRNKFGALNKFSKLCSETNRVINTLCDKKQKKMDESKYSRKFASGDRGGIKNNALSEEAVNYLPTACYVNTGFLKKNT